MRRGQLEIAAVIASELMRGPQSLKSLCLMLGVRERSTTLPRRYVQAYRAQGLVYIHSWWRNQYPVYSWQPHPWALPDVPQPPNRPEREKLEAAARRKAAERKDKALHKAPQGVPNVANSVFSLGAMQ